MQKKKNNLVNQAATKHEQEKMLQNYANLMKARRIVDSESEKSGDSQSDSEELLDDTVDPNGG